MQTAMEKAKVIRLLILDVDGVLTNGTVYYGSAGMEMKGFHIHDGLGMKLLQQSGVTIAVISGNASEPVAKRLKDLDIAHAYLGHINKLPVYEELKHKLQIKDHEIAYVGDDLIDIPLLRRVGLAITVPEAPLIVKQYVDLITKNSAGVGAVREICELIMIAQDSYQPMIESFLTK